MERIVSGSGAIRTQTNKANWLGLILTPHIGPKTIQKLLQHFGDVNAIFDQNSQTLSQFVKPQVANLITTRASLPLVDKHLTWETNSPNNHIITFEDDIYPYELKHIDSPPPVIFAQGNIDLLRKKKIAIVGTRKPTTQGKENSFLFGQGIANSGFTVVSGMAEGIDRHAHLGALSGNSKSIGVVGTGINVYYPKNNSDLYSQMFTSGLIISELPLDTQPSVHTFPARNRIISGLSKCLLVIESGIDGGSMISALYALEMGREVMAVPGSIHNPMARGTHKLIKNGAKLVENVNDILEELNLNPQNQTVRNNSYTNTHPILEAMGFEPVSVDTICSTLNQEFGEICAKILDFELSGLIINCGNGKYQRIFKGQQ